MDADDVARVVESLRRALSADPDRAGEVVERFGWSELLDDEPRVAVSALFSLAGELLTSGSTIDEVMLTAGGVRGVDGIGRVVLPAPASRSGQGGIVDGSGEVLVDGVVQHGDGRVLVSCLTDDGNVVLVACDVDETPGAPLDETAGWVRVCGRARAVKIVDPPSAEHDSGGVWAIMTAAGRRAFSYELVGVSGAMEAMTVEHVRTREQFGIALGSFQAVKHQLADVHLWRRVAELSADAAWEDSGPVSAALAKVAAVRSSRTARAACQQLLGGMGFTWEHEFHRYLRRALTVEPLLGTSAAIHSELGSALRAGGVGHDLVAL